MATTREILNIISSDLSKQNIFTLKMRLPNISELNQFSDSQTSSILEYYVQDASIPSQDSIFSEIRYLGELKYSIKGSNIDSIVVKFLDTKDLKIRKIFKVWQDAITRNNRMNVLKYFPNEYQTKLELTVHETQFQILGAFPITIGDFVLSNSALDTLGTFDVTFKLKSVE